MEKIKHWITSEKGKTILLILILIWVGLASFGLGKLSSMNKASGVKIEYAKGQTKQEANVLNSVSNNFTQATETSSSGQNYFASKRGKKYYGTSCDAGKSIKKENRIYFSSKALAEQAGYELSSSCR